MKLGWKPALPIWEDPLLCNTTLSQDDWSNLYHLLPDPLHGGNSNGHQDDVVDEPACFRLLLFFFRVV